MFSLQQFDDAEERVHAWHGEMKNCIDEQRVNANNERRSWIAALGYCLGFLNALHLRAGDNETQDRSHTNTRPLRSSR